jgi:uncharacterized Tic20 family protein
MTGGDIGKDNLLGAYCHFPVIGGVLAPLIIYFWKGKDNKELGFQAKQAIVYQILVAVIAFASSFIIGLLSIVLASALGDAGGFLGLILLLVLGVLMLIFVILALMAAWKTYNKVSYEYPVIGKKLR